MEAYCQICLLLHIDKISISTIASSYHSIAIDFNWDKLNFRLQNMLAEYHTPVKLQEQFNFNSNPSAPIPNLLHKTMRTDCVPFGFDVIEVDTFYSVEC